LVDEAQLRTVVEGEAHPQVALVRHRRGVHEELTAHPEVAQECVAGVEGEPEVLPAAPRGGHAGALECLGEVVGTGEVTTHRTGMEDLDLVDAMADQVAFHPAAHDLDLGQLGHRGLSP